MDTTPTRHGKRFELLTFAFLAFGLIPVLSIGVVAAYGFAVWMYQMIAGPPGM